ncbi:MAG: ABC transporter ATP-binding protein [Clostridia bacterium]|nr:ABC transporter ATP-binding protein [Clostridia bacterium]
MLELLDVHTFYGPIEALKGISLEVRQGEIVTLIGANGAGKTTTLRSISGTVAPRQGRVLFLGQPVQGLPPHRIAALGVAHVPEGRHVFARLTVQENLEMGAYLVRSREEVRRRLEYVFAMFPRLVERRRQAAGTMSGGEQQMLAIGRALMSGPRLLLLDEPSMGLAPVLVEQIFETILQLKRDGMTILLVEQNAHQALRIADRGYVLQTGRITLADEAARLLDNPEVQETYLGA